MPTFYQRAWAWIGDNGDDELAAIGQTLGATSLRETVKAISDRGFSICVKLQDGQTEENVGIVPELRNILRNLGGGYSTRTLLAGWSQNREDAVADAEKSNGLLVREQCDCWQTSWEFECKGEPGSTRYNRMSQFVNRALQIQPFAYMAAHGGWIYVQMPNEPNGGWIDWESVRRLYGRWGPECYANAYPGEPSIWPDLAQVTGAKQFSKSYIHPVLGFYGSSQLPASDYIASLRRAKANGFTYGFGVYLAFHLTKADWDAFANNIKPSGTPTAFAWY